MTSTQNDFQRRSHFAQHKSQATTRTANWRFSLVAYLPPLLWVTLGSLPVLAQESPIVPANDGTNTQIILDGNRFNIQGGQLSGDGTNLFHSFELFGLESGQTANFESAPQIENILGRVVGGNPSMIDGMLQVTGGSSNLFLINPAGILFGPDASLNLPADFTATTATRIGFDGNGWFSAFGGNNWADLVGTPNRFDFATVQPGAIVNEGNLAVSTGANLSLLGGTVISTGELQAPEGNIAVAAVPGEHLVRLSIQGNVLNLEVLPQSEENDSPSAIPLTPLSLPELLTGGGVYQANSITVNSDGTVQLTGSGFLVENGDLVVQNVTAQMVTLSSIDRLDTPELEPAPASEPAPEPEPPLAPEPAPEPVPATRGVVEPEPEPVPETEPALTPEPAPEPISSPEAISDLWQVSENLENPQYRSTLALSLENCLNGTILQESQLELLRRETLPNYTQAVQCYEQNLAFAREFRDFSSEGDLLQNLGAAYYTLGSYTQALDYYQQRLALADSRKDSRGRGQGLGGLGAVYGAMGDYDRALEYYQQSLELARDHQSFELEGIILRNLGLTYFALEDYPQALDYHQQSLIIARQVRDRLGEGRALRDLGRTYYKLTDYPRALEYQQQSLAIAREHHDVLGEGRVLENLGWTYYALEDYDRAIDLHQQSLAIASGMGDLHAIARARNNLGDALFQVGRFSEATEMLLGAIEIWESLRSNVGNDDSNKISIFETQELTYGLLQEVLVSHEQYDTALEVAERGRARAFIELVSQRRSPQSPQLEIAPPQLEKIQHIARTQNATLVSYSVIQDVVEADGIRQERDSALYIWVVEPNGDMAFRQVDLKPQRLSLQDLIRDSRELIGVRSSEDSSMGEIVPGDLVKLNDDISYWEPWQVIAVNPEGDLLTLRQSSFSEGISIERPITDVVAKVDSPHAQHPRLQQLHQLLIEPISDLLPANPDDRIIFVPHRELFRVPFAALQDAERTYLIEKHTILTAPAIQVLEFHQPEEERTAEVLPALIVGNPTMPELSFGDVSSPLAPLPHAEREARTIAQRLQTDVLIGERATTATVLEQLPDARIVHLATHGLLDERTGMGSAIALAPSESDDGWLSAADIFELSLDAELVVLSACNTAQGKITGDGVIGLSRSFLSAGAKSLIVSLWMVPDAPTADLMTAFYQHFQENFDKARALRQAMLTTMEQHPHPRNWAAFVLVGES